MAAFANDILLSLASPLTSIPNQLKDIENFGTLSHLKINYAKSHALNVSLTRKEVECCQSSFPFLWYQKAITYLGIQIMAKLADLYNENFLVALKRAHMI